MDKREFYKQLMTQYTLDEEKIRRNSKRPETGISRVLNSKWLPLVSAAAVFVAVFGGYMLVYPGSTGDPVTPYIATTSPASPRDRILNMQYNEIVNDNASSEQTSLYITFNDSLTYNQVKVKLGLISDTGEISVNKLYDVSKSVFVETNEAGEEDLFKAAKISAPASLIAELKSQKFILAVEALSDNLNLNDDNFNPLDEEDLKSVNIATVATTTAVTTTAPVTSESETSETVSELDEITPDDELSEIDNTSSETGEINTAEEPEITEYKLISMAFENAQNVQFINSNTFVVLTDGKMSMYYIEAAPQREITLISEQKILHPEVKYVNHEEDAFIITGENRDGLRNQLFVVDGITSDVSYIELGGNDDEIAYAFYKNGNIIIKTKSNSAETIYVANARRSGRVKARMVCDFEISASILNVDNDSFVYALKDDVETKLFEYNFINNRTSTIEFTQPTNCVFTRSAELSNFAVTVDSRTWIYVAETGSVVELEFEVASLSFNEYDARYFTANGEYYLIDGGAVYLSNNYPTGTPKVFSTQYSVFETTATEVVIKVN